MQKRNATVAVIGAGDFIGGEIAKRFASEGFTIFAGRRNGAKLEPLVKEIEAQGGEIHARSLDARKEEEIAAFLNDADKQAPLEVCIFNIGANVSFPILETTERVFRKVWEMACYSGFLAGREAARLMLARGKGNIFFTGATASLREAELQAERLFEAATSSDRGLRYRVALGQGAARARGSFTDALNALEVLLHERARDAASAGNDSLAAGTAKALEVVERAKEKAAGNVNPQLLTAGLLRELAGLVK